MQVLLGQNKITFEQNIVIVMLLGYLCLGKSL